MVNRMIEFKHHELELEFLSPNLDSRLYFIVLAILGYVQFNYGKSIEITEILRTQEEQDNIYGYRADYKSDPWKSVHQYWRGIDLSVKMLSKSEAQELTKFLNDNLLYDNGDLSIAIYHDVGFGIHIHLQVDNNSYTKIVKTN